jgi:outer membrane protein assembly factor BamB
MKHKSITSIYPILIALIFLLLLCGCSKEEEVGWPRWRGPNGDGISNETDWDPEALADEPNILWKADVGMGFSNVVLKYNRLYAMGMKGVACLNAETGEQIWLFKDGSFPDPQATPTLNVRDLYVLNKSGVLYCLRAKNGKLRWRKDLVSEYDVKKPTYGFSASLVVAGDLLVLTSNTSGLALDKKTGEKVWESSKHPKGKDFAYSTPVLYDYNGKRAAVISSCNGVHAVDVYTGEVLWRYEWEDYSRQVADPLIFDSKVFIAQYAGLGCFLLDIGEGEPKLLWKNRNMSCDTSSPVLIDGYIYGCDGGPEVEFGILRCLDVRTGELMWEGELRAEGEWRMVPVSLIAADGKLIILEYDGTLHIAEATPIEYREISSCKLPSESGMQKWWAPPVLYKGKIYCRNYAGDLVCIDVSKKS